MATPLRTEVEQIKQQPEVKQALKQTAGNEPQKTKPAAKTKDKVWLGTHALVFVGLGFLYFILQFRLFGLALKYVTLLRHLTLAAMAIVLLLAIAKIVDVYAIGGLDSAVSKYNLRRVLKLGIGLIMILIVLSLLFQNWYTAVVSIGLVSLILGFALQTPITSFFAWIYILVRSPYRVGDRIKIGDATGDVIDVSYIDTTLWEFGGDFLSTDHPSGRVIRFPNSRVLSNEVYNYTWPLFPYIWNEIKFSVAYDSDLEFISETMRRITEQELGEPMMRRVRVFRELLAQTPVDQLQVREHPAVLFRINANTWIDAIVRYLVHPKEAGRVKTRLIKKLLAELNAAPDRVMFPKGDAR
jgi:small-conductance mechanosensitive channel